MKHPSESKVTSTLLLAVTLGATLLVTSQAWAQPANRPLLTNQSGAKPNLMVALDNSGSMAFTYHESYAINDEGNVQMRRCPSPFSNSASSTLSVFNAGRDGPAIYSHSTGTYTCFQRTATGQAQVRTNVSIQYVPQAFISNWDAQRSAAFNPVYYDPRVRYLPRVNGDGLPRTPVDPNVVFVSNQNSTGFQYNVFQRNVVPFDYRVYHSFYAPGTINFQGVPNNAAPGGHTSRYNLDYSGILRIPQHTGYAAADAATPAFSYAYCPDPITSDPPSCRQLTRVNVVFGAATNYTIVTPHNRSDCTGNTCTNAQEVANILNWYRWYSNRQLATSTAIGLALADVAPDGQRNIPSKFDGQLRIGYMPINDTTIPNGGLGGNTNLALVNPPGSPASVPTISRGVRTLERGSTANTQVFDWLHNILSRGGTPLHNSIERAADYYMRRNGVTENAWLTGPAGDVADDSEKSCRRSFNLLFSDGGWTGAPTAPSPAGPDYDNLVGPVIEKRNPITNVLEDSLQYNPTGINTVAGRLKYTPFPSTGTGGLADITARYFWRVDMRPGNTVAAYNNVQTRAGQPAFWQNMATYTVGYQIRPTGNVTGTGLTFEQIDQYRTQYVLSGYAAALPKPTWPTGDLLAANNQTRVDDFIHAGYTGGARSFSAQTADDVKGIFNTILAEILSASGRDAGVSVSSGGDSSTLAGQLKYTVSYRTMDNSGNILARALDSQGNETGVTAWSAEQLMPSPATRSVFTMHDTNQPVSFSGAFTGLPTDVQNALKQGPDANRVPNDDSFVNYLRGDNTELDAQGALFRQRTSKIAAMVNPPSVLMGFARDYGYDDVADGGGVDGWDSYFQYSGRKLGYSSSLFVATNAGVMHSFDAATGTEQAAFMPRRSLKRMLAFADEPYNFEYVLDGPVTQNDVFNRRFATQNALPVADQWRAWRHIGVGTGGRGEQLVYAVNSPIKPGANPNRVPDMQDFLWETGPDIVNTADGDDVTLGYIANSARSGQTEDFANQTNSQRGRWIVAVNNGHYNGVADGEKAGLVVLDALTGDVVRTIPLPAGYSAGRGLSGVTLLRNYELHGRVVAAYAGDANGQLWRFNLSGAPSSWHVEHGRPLFTVPGNRPIFGHPAWQYKSGGPQNGFMVVFATGIMLEEGDLDDQGPQTIYGIWDRMDTNGTMVGGPFTEVLPAELQQQQVLPAGTARGSVTYFGITDNQIDWDTQRGWFMRMEHVGAPANDPRTGERSIADVINIGKSVVITSTVLRRATNGEMCTISDLPANYVYILNAETASSARSRSFDVTGDTRLDPFAVAYIPSGGFTRGISVSSFQSLADGTRRVTGVVGAPMSASDPFVQPVVHNSDGTPTSEPLLGQDGNVGLDGEDKEGGDPTNGSKCRNMRAIIIGTETESLQGGVACPTTGWSRTQFQLSAPPTN
jgi:type IV pilus assembly protein PilY1